MLGTEHRVLGCQKLQLAA